MVDHAGLFQELFLRAHSCPLEGSKRLRHKKGGAGDPLDFSIPAFLGNLIIRLGDLFRKQGDPLHILHGFCGKTQHKIQFDPIPAALKGRRSACEDLLLRQALIDHIPKSLGTGLRRKGQAALLHILYLAHNV